MNMLMRLDELEILTYLGVYPHEQKHKSKVTALIEIEFNSGNASKTDRIEDTLDYHALSDHIRNYAEDKRYHLIETLVNDITEIVLSYDRVYRVHVALSKYKPLTGLPKVVMMKEVKRAHEHA